MYLCTVIDVHTRYVLKRGLSNTITAEWCSEIVNEAIQQHGKPENMHTVQGSKFTSEWFTELLKKNEIQISMDGKDRPIDNIFVERPWQAVKYEPIYLKVPGDTVQLYEGLKDYFCFYNNKRLHQLPAYKKPDQCYKQAMPAGSLSSLTKTIFND